MLNFRKIISLILSLTLMTYALSSCETTDEEPKDRKVLLVSIDGLRSDAVISSKHIDRLKEISTYSTDVTTVYPSMTLPCHMSMQHGVDPESHGVFTNTYTPSEELVDGIAETLSLHQKTSAFFYNWEPLGDVISDDTLIRKEYVPGETLGWKEANAALAAACKDHLLTGEADYTFLYLGCLDEMGHVHGWLSDEYFAEIDASLDLVFEIIDILPEEYTVIITSDHGGHDYTHGTDSAEDMTIPIFLIGSGFAKSAEISDVSILDIAPTVADILGISPNNAWQGKTLK